MADAPETERVAVIVPAYQAAEHVAAVVTGARAALPGAAVYVVDDGSSDATGAVATAAGAVVLRHPRNRGKGAALAGGIARALSDGATVLTTLDADGQHPPDVLPLLLAPVRHGDADLVLGARARSGSMPLARRCTNWLSATVATRIGKVAVPDAQTGLRAFTRRLAQELQPAIAGYRRYDYEAAFLLAALRGGYGVRSVEVPTIYTRAGSHFRSWGDGWRVTRVFVRYLLGAS
ncbi:MAG TPA: glycosyltransferase family 2 protein [Gemmatimonadales bacterium]